jgi:hypothetical protein
MFPLPDCTRVGGIGMLVNYVIFPCNCHKVSNMYGTSFATLFICLSETFVGDEPQSSGLALHRDAALQVYTHMLGIALPKAQALAHHSSASTWAVFGLTFFTHVTKLRLASVFLASLMDAWLTCYTSFTMLASPRSISPTTIN